MAFGQQTGPPASAKQLDELAQLFEQAGYTSFREARHIFGLTQRQAAGKFTQGEAVELIERLELDAQGAGVGELDATDVVVPARRESRRQPGEPTARRADRAADQRAELLVTIPADELADELVRRGWICMPPA